MVKLYVLSDLHLEESPFVPPAKTVAAADVIVLAGDICEGDDGAKGIRWAAEAFEGKSIVMIAGNHEYWDGDWNAALAEMRRVAKHCGVHFLENDSVVLENVRFLGSTLWTDYKYFGIEKQSDAMVGASSYLPDYEKITAKPDGSEFLTPYMTTRRHKESLAWLKGELDKPFDGSTVVVTHHFPHKNSCNPKYAINLLTAAYGSKLDEALLRKADLWLHGHTHHSNNYRIGDSKNYVRVMSNPRGFPYGWFDNEWENQGFNPNLLVERLVDGNWAEYVDLTRL
jgi:predicted phosphohydrolase